MTRQKNEQELVAEITELERYLAKWRHDQSPETEFGRRLVRQAITRRRAQLSHLQEVVVLELEEV